MDFTREPVIETIVTPKEGCKIVVRNSKGAGQEEYFVDSVEVVSFGHSVFFRSTEKPKSFLVPVSDYEILEVREARMVLKATSTEKQIKIGGGKKEEVPPPPRAPQKEEQGKKRERRRHSRRTKSQDGTEEGAVESEAPTQGERNPVEASPTPQTSSPKKEAPSTPAALLPPPPSLISETIARYRGDELYKDAFFSTPKED